MIFIKRIDEADFGCEGVPDNQAIKDRVVFEIDGKEIIKEVDERLLWDNKLDEGMVITEELYNIIIN